MAGSLRDPGGVDEGAGLMMMLVRRGTPGQSPSTRVAESPPNLNDLRRAGLVVEEKQGKLVYYGLDATSPCADVVAGALALVADDEAIVSDGALIDRVRAVPIGVLTRSDMKLGALGIKRPAPRVRARLSA